MESIISTFHITWSSLIAQMVNFALVVGVLWYFAFRPLSQAMNNRSAKIEQSLKDAEVVTKKLEATNIQSAQIIVDAKKQADQIIKDAHAITESQREIAVAKVKDQSAKIVAASKIQIEQLKNQAVDDASAELGEIVVSATQALISQKLSGEADQKIIAKILEQAKRL